MEVSNNRLLYLLWWTASGWALFFLFSFMPILLSAQSIDSIGVSFHQKPKLFFKLDSKYSFVDSKAATVYGFKAGVGFGPMLRIGAGYHYLSVYQKSRIQVKNESGKSDTLEAVLKLYYGGLITEYVFYKTAHWEFCIPLQLSIGSAQHEFIFDPKGRKDTRRTVMLYEPSVAAQYKIFPWLGTGVEIGYRIMLVNHPAIRKNFNSPTYSFKVMLFFGELIKMVFPASSLAKKMN